MGYGMLTHRMCMQYMVGYTFLMATGVAILFACNGANFSVLQVGSSLVLLIDRGVFKFVLACNLFPVLLDLKRTFFCSDVCARLFSLGLFLFCSNLCAAQ